MPVFPLARISSLVAALILTRPRAAVATALGCDENSYGASTTTKLDFFPSTVASNTLHLDGGELRYDGVGIVRDRPISLVVTVTSGNYTEIAEAWWNSEDRDGVSRNGKSPGSAFANIEVRSKGGAPRSGEGNFRMCLVDTETSEPIKAEKFTWTVFDIDQRNLYREYPIYERLRMDTSQTAYYQVWPNTTESEIIMTCEDGSDLPCQGTRTEFRSSSNGDGRDNPTDPNSMTSAQKKRSIAFTFVNTDCWDFTFDLYCLGEQDGGTGRCFSDGSYHGGHLVFAGDSAELINEGECLTQPPRPSASPSASNAPSLAPVRKTRPPATAAPILAPARAQHETTVSATQVLTRPPVKVTAPVNKETPNTATATTPAHVSTQLQATTTTSDHKRKWRAGKFHAAEIPTIARCLDLCEHTISGCTGIKWRRGAQKPCRVFKGGISGDCGKRDVCIDA